MTEQEFTLLADAELARLEAVLEAAIDAGDEAVELETRPGGILELAFGDGSKIIINRHLAAQEIWLAARSGGYHFAWNGTGWHSARDDGHLWPTVTRCLAAQGAPVCAAQVGRAADATG